MIANVIGGLQGLLQLPEPQWHELLGTSGLTPQMLEDGDGPIPLRQGFAAFERIAEAMRRPRLGLEYAEHFAVGGTGPIGFAMVSATTVRQALQTIARFMPLVASLQFSRYEEDEQAGSIIWQYPVPPETPRIQYLSWGIAVVTRRLRDAMPDGWRPLAVEIDIKRPPYEAMLAEEFGPGFHAGCPLNRFAVQAELLDLPSPMANERLFELMTRLAEIELQRRGVSASVFEADARQAITPMLRQGRASAADLAQAMGLSLAELRRGLKENHLDFRSLLDDVRKEAARNYLQQTDLSITEIAFALGYSESSVFTRACHKWFGKPPRDMRARALLL